MLRSLRNIRKIDNAKILFVSCDPDLKEILDSQFNHFCNEVVLVTKSEEGVKMAQSGRFDIAIIDTRINGNNLVGFCSELMHLAPTLPKIIISQLDHEDDIVTAVNVGAYTFLSKPLNIKDLKLAITMCLNQTKRGDKIKFDNGIYYDEYRDQFYRTGGLLIEFTKLEKSFLKLLISRKNEIIDYEIIKDVVWNGKDMSIFTMRNIVNKIRQKSYYQIVKNHSNRGYTIDTSKMN